MAATRIVGNDGNVTMPTGHNFEAQSWSLNINQVVTDITSYSDTWRTMRGGVKGGSGSISGVPEYDDTGLAPNADTLSAAPVASMVLTMATGCTYGSSIVVESFDLGSSKTGDATIALNFQTSGAVTETWDETA